MLEEKTTSKYKNGLMKKGAEVGSSKADEEQGNWECLRLT